MILLPESCTRLIRGLVGGSPRSSMCNVLRKRRRLVLARRLLPGSYETLRRVNGRFTHCLQKGAHVKAGGIRGGFQRSQRGCPTQNARNERFIGGRPSSRRRSELATCSSVGAQPRATFGGAYKTLVSRILGIAPRKIRPSARCHPREQPVRRAFHGDAQARAGHGVGAGA